MTFPFFVISIQGVILKKYVPLPNNHKSSTVQYEKNGSFLSIATKRLGKRFIKSQFFTK